MTWYSFAFSLKYLSVFSASGHSCISSKMIRVSPGRIFSPQIRESSSSMRCGFLFVEVEINETLIIVFSELFHQLCLADLSRTFQDKGFSFLVIFPVYQILNRIAFHGGHHPFRGDDKRMTHFFENINAIITRFSTTIWCEFAHFSEQAISITRIDTEVSFRKRSNPLPSRYK